VRPFPKAEYQAAVEAESTARNFAFVDVAEDVNGVAVRPMTLRDVMVLDGIKSPFMVGGSAPSPQDLIVFLWLQSPSYSPSSFKLWLFTRKHRSLNYADTCKAIINYIDAAFMDSPGGKRSGESFYSFAACIVDSLANQYGWREQDILNMPLKRIWQYMNCIKARLSPKPVLFNPLSGKVRREWLIEMNKGN
jgi:hypothetical protein